MYSTNELTLPGLKTETMARQFSDRVLMLLQEMGLAGISRIYCGESTHKCLLFAKFFVLLFGNHEIELGQGLIIEKKGNRTLFGIGWDQEGVLLPLQTYQGTLTMSSGDKYILFEDHSALLLSKHSSTPFRMDRIFFSPGPILSNAPFKMPAVGSCPLSPSYFPNSSFVQFVVRREEVLSLQISD